MALSGAPQIPAHSQHIAALMTARTEELLAAIQKVRTEMNNPEFRSGVRETFKAKFDAETNYRKYYQELITK